MKPVARVLLERIRREGDVFGEIIKVDRFLNHMVDPGLIEQLAADIAGRYAGKSIDKILTAETSGIILAHALAAKLAVPFVYAKKKRPLTMGDAYTASSYSFTKQEATTLYVAKEVLNPGEKILFVDDFFATGATFDALAQVVHQAQAQVVGAVVIINKSERQDIDSILTKDDLSCL